MRQAGGWAREETEKQKEWNRQGPVSHVKGCVDLVWSQWGPTQGSAAVEHGGVHCNPRTWEPRQGTSQVPGSPGLHRDTVSSERF